MKLHRYFEQQRLHITTMDRHSYLSSSWVIRPGLIWKMFLTCSSFTIWNIWMKLHIYVDHQRLHIVTKDVISLSISVLLLFRHYISHKITFGAPSSGGVLCSACGAFICKVYPSIHPADVFLHNDSQKVCTLIKHCHKVFSVIAHSCIPWYLSLHFF